MKKIALIAALPLALGLAACKDSTPAVADGDATTATATDDAMAADTSVVPPSDATPAAQGTAGMTQRQQAEVADEKAEALEEKADRIESTNEAAADKLEAEAKRLQNERDAKR